MRPCFKDEASHLLRDYGAQELKARALVCLTLAAWNRLNGGMKITGSRFAALTMAVFAIILQARAAETWEVLFNGQDLSGWSPVHDVSFTVTNGNLRLVKGMGWLRTEKEYTNFVFEAEWMAFDPGYDSGFFLRAGLEGKPWPKDGWQVNLSSAALGGLVKGYKTVVPAETPRKPLNQWVKFRIEVRGKKVTLDVDGERAWEYDNLDAQHGYLGIQAENKSFDFRNVRVLRLPD
jgi:hypothetical protein